MKRLIINLLFLVVFLLIFTIFNVNFSLGQVTCSTYGADDVILRLSGQTNAHGEEYNGAGNYPYEICYSTIFGQAPPSSPDRTCASTGFGANTEEVITLHQSTNAHGEVPGAGLFSSPVNVCYEDLTCQPVSTSTGCSSLGAGYQEVVILSDVSDAHMAMPGTASGFTNPTSICCSAQPPPPVGGFNVLEWTDFEGNHISSSQAVCLGTWVKARATTGGWNGLSIETGFREQDLFPNPDNHVSVDLSGTVENNEVVVEFYLDEDLLDTQASGANDPDYEMYFNMTEPSSSTFDESLNYPDGVLDVTDDPTQCLQSTGPTGGITGPVHLGIYYVGNEIEMTSSCSSSLGPVQHDWVIEHNGVVVNTSDVETYNFTLSASYLGNLDITLTCTDIQGISIQDQVAILVSDSPGIISFVNDPAHWGVEYNSPPPAGTSYYPKEVSFSASDSYVMLSIGDLSGSGTEQWDNCVAYCMTGDSDPATANPGDCPSMTEGTPNGCPGPLTVENIDNFNNIYLANIASSGYPPYTGPALQRDLSDIDYQWTFSDSNWNEVWSLNGLGQYTGFIEYDDMSDDFDDKHIDLDISTAGGNIEPILTYLDNYYISAGLSNFIQSSVLTESKDRDFTLGRCLNGGNEFISDPATHTTISTLEENNACAGGDLDPSTHEDNCCPTNMFCADLDGDTDYKCEPVQGPIINICGDYENQIDCVNDDFNVAENSYTGPLNSCQFLECYWETNPPGGGTGVCGIRAVTNSQDPTTGQCNPGEICENTACNWIVEETDCINGEKTITRTVALDPNPSTVACPGVTTENCDVGTSQTTTVACGRLDFQLPFFGYIQFLAAAVSIALIYSVLGFRKKKK